MRRKALALLSAIVVSLMMIPGGVSAKTITIEVEDMTGDLGPKYDPVDGAVLVSWPETNNLVKAGIFDMLSFSLSYSSKEMTYTFGMEVSKALPEEGSPLPTGFHTVQWLMWIDSEPWNPVYNPAAETWFTVELSYDGVAYVAELRQGLSAGPVLATLPFSVDGSKLQIQFSSASIGDLDSFWFMPCTVVRWSPVGTGGYWDLDSTDPGAVAGQVWWDIPWGDVESVM